MQNVVGIFGGVGELGCLGCVWGCLRGVMIGVVYRAVMRCNIEHGGGLSLLLRVMMTPKYAFNLVKINSK